MIWSSWPGQDHPINGLEYLAEALNIAASGKVKPMVELFPSENVNEAAARATAGDVRVKAVVIY